MIDRGISPARIFCEATSYDTIGNAYFSLMQLAEPLGWNHILVITSQFHMLRCQAIFRWIYSLDSTNYKLDFASSADDGLSKAALSARLGREQDSLLVV